MARTPAGGAVSWIVRVRARAGPPVFWNIEKGGSLRDTSLKRVRAAARSRSDATAADDDDNSLGLTRHP
jgi:hypothetical protein